MKKLLFLAFLFALPFFSYATPTSWDFTSSVLQPLQSQWSALVKADHFQATSTTPSIFPTASTTELSATTLCLTNDCRTVWPAVSATGLATSSPLSNSNLLVYSNSGAGSAYGVATSTLNTNGGIILSGTGFLVGGTGITLTAKISTSTVPNVGDLTYWTGNGTPSLLGTVATSTLTPSSPLTGSFTQIGSGGSLGLGTVGIANGGTATTTGGVTNGVEYFNGTNFTNGSGFIFNGTNIGIGTTTPPEILTLGFNSGGHAGTATQNGLLVADSDTGSSWDIANPFASVSFATADGSTVGAGVRDQVGAVMENVAGGSSRLGFFTAPTTAGTLLERLSILSGGSVGIGSTSPSATLGINQANASTNGLYVQGFANNNVPTLKVVAGSSPNANPVEFRSPNGAASLVMGIGNTGAIGIGSSTPFARLSVQGVSNGTGLTFQTTDSSSNPTVSILDNGKVGIGTSTPSVNLEVYNTGSPRLRIDTTATTNSPGIELSIASSRKWLMYNDGTNSNNLNFRDLAGNDVLTMGQTGSIGIGTTTPASTFSVVGNAYIAGNITATSTATSTFSGPVRSTCFSTDGTTCLATSGGTVGSGTTGQFPYYAGSGTSLTATSSLFIGTQGNIGVGSTTPDAKFSVFVGGNFASQAASTAFAIGSSTAGNATSTLLSVSSAGTVIGFNSNWSITSLGAAVFATNVQSPLLTGTANNVAVTVQNRSFTAAGNPLTLYTGSNTNSSGQLNAVRVTPTVNQTGTAGETDFLINRTETAVGSGPQLLFDAQVGGVSRAEITNAGLVGIGTTTPFANLSVAGLAGGTTPLFAISSSTAGFATTTTFLIDANGNETVRGSVTWPYLATPAGAFLAVNATGQVIATTSPSGGGVTSIQQLGGGTAQTGAITLATTTQTTNGQTIGLTITNTGGAFTFNPTFSGTLGISGGGTATSTGGVTNGVEYYDGTRITNGTGLIFNGTKLGIGSTTPFANLSVSAAAGLATASLFQIASTTNANLFSINAAGGITVVESQPATSTTQVIDWSATGPQVNLRIGTSATTITLINATTSAQAGSRKMVWVCNPGSTAGAITWSGVEWSGGTVPTQTTTANVCDAWSFDVTAATSSTAYKVFGTQGSNFQ